MNWYKISKNKQIFVNRLKVNTNRDCKKLRRKAKWKESRVFENIINRNIAFWKWGTTNIIVGKYNRIIIKGNKRKKLKDWYLQLGE